MIEIAVIAVVAVLDLLVKNYIERYYWLNRDRYILGGFVRIGKSHNKGGFLNAFEKKTREFKKVSYVVMGAVIIILGMALIKKKKTATRIGLSMILGGAVSNEYDRLIKGSVTDYFGFNLPGIRRINFNLADIAIFAGAVMTCIGEER